MFEKTFPGPFFNSTPLVITSRRFTESCLTSEGIFFVGAKIFLGGVTVIAGFGTGFGDRDSFGPDGAGTDRAGVV